MCVIAGCLCLSSGLDHSLATPYALADTLRGTGEPAIEQFRLTLASRSVDILARQTRSGGSLAGRSISIAPIFVMRPVGSRAWKPDLPDFDQGEWHLVQNCSMESLVRDDDRPRYHTVKMSDDLYPLCQPEAGSTSGIIPSDGPDSAFITAAISSTAV